MKSNKKLPACPNSPNCVSTQSTDKRHTIEPMTYEGSITDAMHRITNIINSMERSKIITTGDDCLKVEFKSALFRFVDDVEFHFDDESKVIHFRSVSRVGYGDMGVNRKRMERIRSLFNVEQN